MKYIGIWVKLFPNEEQQQTLNQVLGCYRFIYNQMLSHKKEAYEKDKTNLGLTELSKWFHGTLLKDENLPWLRERNTKVLKQAIRQMLDAYKNFFKHHKGFPKFKCKHDRQSAKFPIGAISKKNTFETRHITLTKTLKNLKLRCSDLQFKRLQKYKDSIRSATLSKTKGGNYYLSILVECEDSELKKFEHTGKQVGIDLGVKDFVITSDGEVFENKHFLKKEERLLKRRQRQLSKKTKGSNNRNKARIRLAKVYEKITNKRLDYIHCVTNSLLRDFDVIFMEDLNVQGMLKNHHLAKAIQEVGFGQFKQILMQKAENNGKQVVLVDRFYASSKTCSKCGYKKKDLTLKDRYWTCPVCGEHHDRDINAAVNILKEGQRMLSQ